MSTLTASNTQNQKEKYEDEDDNSCSKNATIDYDDFSNCSILEFLNKEQECFNGEDCSELDVESIFEEINRLSDNTDERPVDEILREAETLLKKQKELSSGCGIKTIDNKNKFCNVADQICPDSIISQESTPRDMFTSSTLKCVDDSEGSDNVDDITDGIESISISRGSTPNKNALKKIKKITPSSKIIENIKILDVIKDKKFESNNENTKYVSNKMNIRPQTVLNENLHTEVPSIKTFTTPKKTLCNKSTNSSPKHYATVNTSPIIDNVSITREYALKIEIERLQEKLKDTEERLQSLRIQHDSLSQLHRDLRDNHTHLQEESELIKLDVQHLTECANILRSELKSARNDRNEALEVQKILQNELEESKTDKKKAQEQCEKDAKTIQDLQRQCKEMERILMRKHPDSVSALIVASKNSVKGIDKETSGSRKLLEQRIAQLEADAKEQDLKAQKILANVQARFNSVQAKYETHIADLETQVLSLQEINAKLNEKIESQINAFTKLNNIKRNLISEYTQTDDIAEKEVQTKVSSTQTDSKITSIRQIPVKKPSNTPSKISVSHSDSTISAYHAAAKEDAHLLATIRGMRVDLAIKDKAMQRLTRELDECKKTIKKLQKEKEAMKNDKATTSFSSRKTNDVNQSPEQLSDSQALREALNKIKLLEFDYKALHDKRLQDLKTLQAAHERELASCHETVRILQQRLTERDENFATQKRRKVPIDYYALKAKVSSLERRHSEREQRLHMLVEALSKGRLNGALEEILNENSQ